MTGEIQVDEKGKTDTVKNTADPIWQKPITVIYRRKSDTLKIMLCDAVSSSSMDDIELSIQEVKNTETNNFGYFSMSFSAFRKTFRYSLSKKDYTIKSCFFWGALLEQILS